MNTAAELGMIQITQYGIYKSTVQVVSNSKARMPTTVKVNTYTIINHTFMCTYLIKVMDCSILSCNSKNLPKLRNYRNLSSLFIPYLFVVHSCRISRGTWIFGVVTNPTIVVDKKEGYEKLARRLITGLAYNMRTGLISMISVQIAVIKLESARTHKKATCSYAFQN